MPALPKTNSVVTEVTAAEPRDAKNTSNGCCRLKRIAGTCMPQSPGASPIS